MRGRKGRYKKPSGAEETRWHFPAWELPGGQVVQDVSIFPHPCEACAGGDHTHVEINDTRQPLEVLEESDVDLPPHLKLVIDRHLEATLGLNIVTGELAKLLG